MKSWKTHRFPTLESRSDLVETLTETFERNVWRKKLEERIEMKDQSLKLKHLDRNE